MTRRILHAEEDKLVYEPVKSSLELTWDSLATYYTKKAQELQSSKITNDTIMSKFQQAKVELETIQSTFNLMDNKVLTTEKVNTKVRKRVNLSRKIVADSLKIIKNKINMLQNAMKKEETILDIINNYECIIDNGQLKIVFGLNHYILVEGDKLLYPDSYTPKGLKCTIEFKGDVYTTIQKCKKHVSEIESVKEYCLEKELIGEYVNGNIKIKVEECEDEEEVENELCMLILNKMKRRVEIEKLFEIVVCYLCRLFCREFYKGLWEIVDTGINRMIDGLSAEYFLVTKGVIIRVERFKNDFKIFYNEREIKKRQFEDNVMKENLCNID